MSSGTQDAVRWEVLLGESGPLVLGQAWPVSLVGLEDQQHTVVFVFISNKSDTLPLATRYNVKCVGLSPDGRLAIIVDEGIRP